MVDTPWSRVRKLGYSVPTIYNIPWSDRAMASLLKAKNVPGVGYVGEYDRRGIDYLPDDYSWIQYCQRMSREDHTTPSKEGLRTSSYTPRPDQQEDIDTIVEAHASGAPEFLIANGTGTGKTVTAWRAVQELRPSSVLVVCPAPVMASWRQHIRDMGDHGMDVVVINYESMRKMVAPSARAISSKKTSTQNKYVALDGKPYVTFDVVVFDESHKLKEPTSQRSRICDTFANHANFIIRLTATPGKDPAALNYLWRGLSWSTGSHVSVTDDKDFDNYVKWCRSQGIEGIVPAPFGNGISWKGSDKDLETMRSIIYSHSPSWAIKRVPETWAETVRQPLPLAMDADDRASYAATVEEAYRAISEGFTATSASLDTGLAAMVRLRQKTGMIKAPHVVEFTKYCLNDLEEQVVISSIFHNTTNLISELLDKANIPHVIATGDHSPEEKEENRLAFQRGDVPVIITSTTTGISLHAGEESSSATSTKRRLIIADAHWSPVEHIQVEGRINRNGQTGVVTIPYLEDSMDEKVMKTLIGGLTTMSTIQDKDDVAELELLARVMGIERKK